LSGADQWLLEADVELQAVDVGRGPERVCSFGVFSAGIR